MTPQSCKWSGRSTIRAGRSVLRQALHRPALVAMRFNPDLKRVCDRLIGTRKHAKIAIATVMRKLVVLADALQRNDRLRTPKEA
ncbi:hypothetical protein AA101099_0156 [Neoasaia chiangmaiensis NBRC 101099]|uniref:Uncharacterized protein n=1 Tax=Neoasaia chiangmaiensis TaxID=320497 RepID=A0A1U9KLT8_9PROT|nr:transposase [Neoasaia chiangmaiensis]AQS86690.1 hypothetical protein A0U93_00580 [Neoasaia chiangmaiensis]GBR35831.1 hypothetical protein AA101099_0156 [Neoasaia chiangmaiensis NBRC 101099]GEN16638.1 hypothetical protein NCH01_30690 [Neoasaia chiangmaiensis]